jgi:hypothetical protein
MDKQPKLTIVPVFIREAKKFVYELHRHLDPPKGALFAVGVEDEHGKLRGVAITGRPVAQLSQDGFTAEILRVATDGCPNACSCLYRASDRIAKAMGYRRVLTKTLPIESGISLKAAGFRLVGNSDGGTWSRPKSGRRRRDKHPTGPKLCWESE